jgi:alginate O-acetyltransferase complex protein AlgI
MAEPGRESQRGLRLFAGTAERFGQPAVNGNWVRTTRLARHAARAVETARSAASRMIYTDALFIISFVVLWGLAQALRARPVWREWLIIAFSLVFVASWGLFSVALLLAMAGVNFVAIKAATAASDDSRRRVLGATVAFDLLVLIVFKYGHFIGANLPALPAVTIALPALGIPLAISFYTFHLISYLVDISKQQTRPLRLRQYLFYLCFFPHVVAGPIVRTWQLAPQLGKIRRVPGNLAFGVHFFVLGFFLKSVIANNLADAIDPIWDGEQAWQLSAADRWVTAFLYYCQIYADFAGYTLMALGMARLLGYRLPPNFRGPLLAGTMQEFWRRWHRTLSFWLRDYLYIPLGGNRGGRFAAVRNIFITMALGGLWHGAGWNFLIWGVMHGVGIGAERLLGMNRGGRRLRWPWWLCTQVWVTLAWVFFRAPDLSRSSDFIGGMLQLNSPTALALHAGLALPLLFASAAVLHQLTPLWISRVPRRRLGAFLGVTTGVLLAADVILYSPHKVFIYFAF